MPTEAPIPTVVELYESREGYFYRRWAVLWNGVPMMRTFPSLDSALDNVAAMLVAWEQWNAAGSPPEPSRGR